MTNKILLLFPLALYFYSCSKHSSATNSNGGGTTNLPVISGFNPSSAAVDSFVTITGSNFSTDITQDIVKFNDTIAIVNSASVSQIVVVVPPGASNGKITVTVLNQTATSVANFTVSDHWSLMRGFPGSLMGNVVSFRVGNKLYLGLGEGAGTSNLGVWQNEFWQYDAIANVWTRKADYPGVSTGFGVGFSIADKGYVVMN